MKVNYPKSEGLHPKGDETTFNGSSEAVTNKGTTENKSRMPGQLKGQIIISDNFDEPMSEEELALWYGGSVFPSDE